VEIQLPQILFQIVNFAIVLFVLKKFLLKPIKKVLDERSDRVAEGMKAAEENIKAQEEMEKTAKAEIAKARKEAAAIVAEAKKDAEKKAAEIIEEAKADAKKAVATERRALEAAMADEKKRLQSQLAELITATTEQVLADGVNEKMQHEIIKSQIAKIKEVRFV
jgi:F-type H+-transporting ATPase subunit b